MPGKGRENLCCSCSTKVGSARFTAAAPLPAQPAAAWHHCCPINVTDFPLPNSIRDAGGLHRQPDLFQRGCADTGRISAVPCSGVTHGLWLVGDPRDVSGAGAETIQLCQVFASPSLGGKKFPPDFCVT